MPNADNLKGHGFDTNPQRINRKGRPKKLPELEELIVDLLGEKGSESQMREILKTLIELAVGGNLRAAEILLNRAYGRVKETVEITSNDGGISDAPKIIPSPCGHFKDEQGNTIGVIDPARMDMFNFRFKFVANNAEDKRAYEQGKRDEYEAAVMRLEEG